MNQKKINLYFYKLQSVENLVTELKNIFERKQFVNIIEAESLDSFNNEINITGVLIFKIETKVDLQEAVYLLKKNAENIRLGVFRPACILESTNPKIEKILRKYLCKDFFDATILPKSFSFKIDFWFKNIRVNIQNELKKNPVSFSSKKKDDNDEKDPKVTKAKFEMVKGVQFKQDLWLFLKKIPAKLVLGKWVVRLQGPSSLAVSWTEVSNICGFKNAWKMVVKSSAGTKFFDEEGNWYFVGNRPDFNWRENLWIFGGKEIYLFFKKEEEQFFKINSNEEGLLLTEDSQTAMDWEELVLDTFDSEYSFDKDKVKDGEKSIENENEYNSKLKGNNNADEKEDSSWQGETSAKDTEAENLKGESSFHDEENDSWDGHSSKDFDALVNPRELREAQEQADTGPLEGEINENFDNLDDSNLEGRVASDKLSGNLSGEINENFDKLSKPKLQGRGSKEENKGPLSGVRTKREQEMDDILSMDNFNTNNQQSDGTSTSSAMSGPLAGEGDKADEIDNFNRGQINNTEEESGPLTGAGSQADEIEDDENSVSTNAIDEPLSGNKNSVERIEKAMKGRTNSPISKDKKDREQEEFDEAMSNKFNFYDEGSDPSIRLESGTITAIIKKDNIKMIAKFDELYEDEVVLRTNSGECVIEDKVEIEVSLEYSGKFIQVDLVAEVQSIEQDEEDIVSFKVIEINKKNYEAFLKLYSQRQACIISFMDQAKGVA